MLPHLLHGGNYRASSQGCKILRGGYYFQADHAIPLRKTTIQSFLLLKRHSAGPFAFFIVIFSFPAHLLSSSPRHLKCLSYLIACSLNKQRSSLLAFTLVICSECHFPSAVPPAPSLTAQIEYDAESLSDCPACLGPGICRAYNMNFIVYVPSLSPVQTMRFSRTSPWIPRSCLLEYECICSQEIV